MNEEARLAKNAYLRDWRKRNKDKTKKHNETYWEKKIKQVEGEKSC
jgi:hypothetical protein